MDLSLIHWYLQAFIIFLKVENICQTLFHTNLPYLKNIIVSFQSPPTNQWSGFYMIGTSIMKELRNHKVIRKNSGTRFPIYSHKERGNQFFSTVWGQLFSTYANFSKELTFLTPQISPIAYISNIISANAVLGNIMPIKKVIKV